MSCFLCLAEYHFLSFAFCLASYVLQRIIFCLTSRFRLCCSPREWRAIGRTPEEFGTTRTRPSWSGSMKRFAVAVAVAVAVPEQDLRSLDQWRGLLLLLLLQYQNKTFLVWINEEVCCFIALPVHDIPSVYQWRDLLLQLHYQYKTFLACINKEVCC